MEHGVSMEMEKEKKKKREGGVTTGEEKKGAQTQGAERLTGDDEP
jgi:hypothetical protein